MAKKPLRRLSIWRLKAGQTFDDVISEAAVAFQTVDIQLAGATAVRLLTKQSPSRVPDWVPFLKEGFVQLNPLQTQSAAALLLVEVEQRIFALSFGSARFWLNKESLGLRLVQSQKAIAVARATPDRKLAASLS